MIKFSDEEFHVFMAYLKKYYPTAYNDSMEHLRGYQEFMVDQAKVWFELKQKTPEMTMPRSIEKTIARKVCDMSVSENDSVNDIFEDDDFFRSPTTLKMISNLFDTPCPKKDFIE